MEHRDRIGLGAWAMAGLLLACAGQGAQEPADLQTANSEGGEAERTAEVELETAPGVELEAEADFYEMGDAVRVVMNVKQAPPGKHGVHVHEKGDCSDIPGKSMGSHFAPRGEEHGLPGDPERHLGDLGNVDIDDQGNGTLVIVVRDATLEPGQPTSFAGRALVIHEGEDTGRGESGESGKPIACGVIEP